MTENTLLFRQVHPSWVQEGRVTSQVFKPTAKDNGRLSVYDGDQITAIESWKHHTITLRFTSAGVLAVTVHECTILDLPVEPAPTPFPAHTVINFNGCTSSQIEKKAKYLKRAAEDRGWLYNKAGEG